MIRPNRVVILQETSFLAVAVAARCRWVQLSSERRAVAQWTTITLSVIEKNSRRGIRRELPTLKEKKTSQMTNSPDNKLCEQRTHPIANFADNELGRLRTSHQKVRGTGITGIVAPQETLE